MPFVVEKRPELIRAYYVIWPLIMDTSDVTCESSLIPSSQCLLVNWAEVHLKCVTFFNYQFTACQKVYAAKPKLLCTGDSCIAAEHAVVSKPKGHQKLINQRKDIMIPFRLSRWDHSKNRKKKRTY